MTMRLRRTTAIAAAAFLAVVAHAHAEPDAFQPRFEGNQTRRAQLQPLEYQPFPAFAWRDLTSWANGSAPTPEQMQGNVVLIVTWSSWLRASHAGLRVAADLHRNHGDKGLIVVGVHHQTGFDRAADTSRQLNLPFPYAHDENNRFRENLLVDNDPDFYIIDRAGRLRYADVVTSSVADAVAHLLAETPEHAAKVTQPAAAAPRATTPAPDANQNPVRPDGPLNVEFNLPPASTYRNVNWPPHIPGGLNERQIGDRLPRMENAVFIGERPNTKGRIVVIDFWATWCGPCRAAIPELDRLQARFKDDIVVIGLSNEQEPVVRQFLGTTDIKHDYPQAVQTGGALQNALGIRGIPHAIVVSTDGVIRWRGNPHPRANMPQLVETIEKLLDVDPGIKARRDAERDFLRTQAGA